MRAGWAHLVLKVVLAEVSGLGGSPVPVCQGALCREREGRVLLIKGDQAALPRSAPRALVVASISLS